MGARILAYKLAYWPTLEFHGELPQVASVLTADYWSGFMSEARGLNWDRKSRYGMK